MSNFRETFTKEDKGENQLTYDEIAFHYFFIVLLSAFAIPWTYFFIKNNVLSKKKTKQELLLHQGPICKSSVVQAKVKPPELTFGQKVWNFPFIQLIIIILLWYTIYNSITVVTDGEIGEIKIFDPFEILDINSEASNKEIKSAFRKKSLLYHPDKNPGDNIAAGKYLQVTRAYEILTSELARANYEKYGNPDGPAPLRFGIGIPLFLLDEENHVLILCVAFFIMLILIPGSVIYWMNNSSKFTENGVIADNTPLLQRSVSENLTVKKLIEILAVCIEFQELPHRNTDIKELNNLDMEMKVTPQSKKKRVYNPKFLKNITIIHAYLQRKKLSPGITNDVEYIVSKSGPILEYMLDISFAIGLNPRSKRIGLRAMTTMLDFSQMLYQAIGQHESTLFQLPNISEFNLKEFANGKRTTIQQFLDAPTYTKLEKKLTAEQIWDIKETLKILPRLRADVNIVVQADKESEDSDIHEGDIVTIKIEVERLQLEKEDDIVGPAHSLRAANFRNEVIYVVVGDPLTNRVFYMKKFKTADKIFKDDTGKFMTGKAMPPAFLGVGDYHWEAHIKSDCYRGLDLIIPIKFKILPEIQREIYVHPDDANLEAQTSWIHQLAGATAVESESEEEMPVIEEDPELEIEDENEEEEDLID